MAEVSITFRATHFGASYKKFLICLFHYVLFGKRLGETGPAGTAFEFVERAKEWFAAYDIDVNAGPVIVPIFVGKRTLRAVLTCNIVLLRGELPFELFVRRLTA